MARTQLLSSLNSTIVRYYRLLAYLAMRQSFALLDRFLPSLGARRAERIWFRIPPLPAAVLRPRAGLPDYEPFEVQFHDGVLRGMRWGEGPNVYLVHGWGGWSLQLSAYVKPLVELGYRVISFDMPGHGVSDPGAMGTHASSLPEFVEALQSVIEAQGPAHAFVAHSMGATAAATVMRDGAHATAAVFLSPMADPVAYTRGFARLLGFGERTRRRLQQRIEHRLGLPMAYFNVPRMARDRVLPPLLVIHDREDREVAWADGHAIAEAWPQARLMSTRGLGHRRIVSHAENVAAAQQFLATHAKESYEPQIEQTARVA